MKYIYITYLFLLSISFGISQTQEDIIIQEIYSSNKLLVIDSLSRKINLYEKLYSEENIDECEISAEEIENKLKLFNFNKGSYSSFLQVIYSKDSTGVYVEKEFSIKNKINENNLIIFKNLPIEISNYKCNKKLLDNKIYYQKIGENNILTIEKNSSKNMFVLSVLDSNCENLMTQEYDTSIRFWSQNNILILSYHNQIIMYYTDNI